MSPEELLPLVSPLLAAQGVDVPKAGDERIARAIRVVLTRSRTTREVAKQVAVRLDGRPVQRDEKAEALIAQHPEGFQKALTEAEKRLAKVGESDWQPEKLEAELRALAESLGMAAEDVFQPIRVALAGGTVSEPVHELVWAVGKAGTLARLRLARKWVAAGT
jgi:glutamyl-tRNA synthetase